ncbi:MAG: hypothetical protein WKG07_38360 [Hymenobacter sp.]
MPTSAPPGQFQRTHGAATRDEVRGRATSAAFWRRLRRSNHRPSLEWWVAASLPARLDDQQAAPHVFRNRLSSPSIQRLVAELAEPLARALIVITRVLQAFNVTGNRCRTR